MIKRQNCVLINYKIRFELFYNIEIIMQIQNVVSYLAVYLKIFGKNDQIVKCLR